MKRLCVKMQRGQKQVTCPICGAVLKWDDELKAFDPVTVCPHLEREDYITPTGPFEDTYDVWFRTEERGLTKEEYQKLMVAVHKWYKSLPKW